MIGSKGGALPRILLLGSLNLCLIGPVSLVYADTVSIISNVSTELPAALVEGASQNLADTLKTPAMSVRVVSTQLVNQLTGKNARNDTGAHWDIHGTDLGHMFWHKDKLHMVFGDTFGRFGFGGDNWRSNVMARVADPDPRNGFPFEAMITGQDGKAKELIRSRKIDRDEKTVIPTYGVSIGDRMVLHYMSVKHWGAVGGNWSVGHSGLAYSDDDGQTWEKPADATWQPCGFEQVAFVMDENSLYSFGIPEGRFGGVKLRRVAPDKILVPNAYEYWDGARWLADPAKAVTIVPAPVGELSVAWSERHRRWMMMYLDENRRAIVLRSATQLTGPWSDAQVVVTANEYPGLYAPYIVPGSELDADLYYTMSLWGPYNVVLMHTTLEWTPGVLSASGGPALQGNATPAGKPD
jgi:Domain of unknown function (DUF4185)